MPDLKTLLQTEEQKEQDAQTKVDAGKAAAADLARLTDIVAQLQALSDGRDQTTAAANQQLTFAKAQSTKLEGGPAKTAQQQLTAALGKIGLDDTQMKAKASDKVLKAPLDPTKVYDDYRQASDQADGDVVAKTLTAALSRTDAVAAKQKIDAQGGALMAAASAVTATLGRAQEALGDAGGKLAARDLAGAWWALARATALLGSVDGAALTTQLSAYTKSVDDYASAKSQSLADDDALAAALATQATARDNVTLASQQVAAALADLVKAHS